MIHPLGFLLSSRTKDGETFAVFLINLKGACSCLRRVDEKTGMFPFLFTSDCNEGGLQAALGDVFPDNTNQLSEKHIKENV